MGLKMQSLKNKLEILDERDERGSFLFFLHRLQWTCDQPFFYLAIVDALKNKWVTKD